MDEEKKPKEKEKEVEKEDKLDRNIAAIEVHRREAKVVLLGSLSLVVFLILAVIGNIWIRTLTAAVGVGISALFILKAKGYMKYLEKSYNIPRYKINFLK